MRQPEAILRQNLDAAERMARNLERSREQAGRDLPVTPQDVSRLTDEQIDRLDLFLARFGKLHDFIVSKLSRSVALASLEDTSGDVSVLDMLRRMEKFGIVESADDWQQLRLLRNSFAHEYLTDDTAIAENINGAFELAPVLTETLKRAERYFAEHIARA
ncbi:hypothetical protein [Thiohalomonas denitrificans]|uniref:hypothetical protein n=1 Tax=Thiohalomonas denitrificans TaxID=415747 RepID=UPI0026EFD80A|nr:hypothetical protein [Thiohalomonas denitrificans]